MNRRVKKNARAAMIRFRPVIAALEDRRLMSADVLTYHYDNARSGLNANEVTLTPANVNASTFGKLGVDAVDGKVDAQPLLKTGVAIPGQGTHDVLFVATENDSLYAFDASSGTLLYKVSELGAGEVPSDPVVGTQVEPTIGITSTPVIDPSTNTMYLVAMSKLVSGNNTTYIQRIHAVNIATGADVVAPQSIDQTITFPGAGPGGNGTSVIFNPKQYEERDALLLSNGVIYTGWSSHSDVGPYTGWLIGFHASNLSVASIFNINPNGSPKSTALDDGSGSSFWNSGGGPAADSAGNIYNESANGPFDPTLNAAGFPANGDYGDSFLKFTPTATGIGVSDYFTVLNQQDYANNDADLGSSGVTLTSVVDASGVTHQVVVGSDKNGNIYVVDTANLGKFSPTSNNIYQELPGAVGGGEFSSPVTFNGQVYFGGVGTTLRAFTFVNGKLTGSPTSQSSNTFSYPGTSASVSANGTTNGIVWAINNNNGAAQLDAYDASNLSTMLYNSDQAGNGRDSAGADNKFITPVVANGRVYVPTTNGVTVYGLLTPVNASSTSVNLAGNFNRTGIVVDGTTFGGGGLDGDNTALSSNLLGPTVTASGALYLLGPANASDVVSAQGQTIALPSGGFGSLDLLATGVNGNQTNQTFVVTYTDGSRTTLTQSLSDWYTSQPYPGESTAATLAYRDYSNGARDARTFHVDTYSIPLDPSRTVQSLTLPSDANVEVLAVSLSTTVIPPLGTSVSLAGSFNRAGIVADGSSFTGGGFDGDETAFSANQLGSTLTAAGVTYNLGRVGSNDVVSGNGQTVALPSGKFATFRLLAAGVNGNQSRQTFVVTYTDGTKVQYTQSISDWATPQGYSSESIAASTSYRDTSNGGRQPGNFRAYQYTFALNSSKTVKSVTLPRNKNVEVLAVNLSS